MKQFFSELSPHGAIGVAAITGFVTGVIYVFLTVYVTPKLESVISVQRAASL